MVPNFQTHGKVYQGKEFLIKKRTNVRYPHGEHFHDFYEFHYISKGQGTLFYNDKTFTIKEGDIIAINIFAPHFINFEKNVPFEYYSIAFNYNFLVFFDEKNNNLFSVFTSNYSDCPISNTNDEQRRNLLDILDRYYNNAFSLGRETIEIALCLEFLVSAFNYMGMTTTEKISGAKHLDIIGKLLAYINDHLTDNLSLDHLTTQVMISKYYLCQVFKHVTGMTISNYIVAKRIAVAKKLILEDKPLTEVLEQSGFNNYSYFYKAFKAHTGASPSSFRNNAEAIKADGYRKEQ